MFKVFHNMLSKCTVSMFTRLSNVVNVNIRQANYHFLPRVKLHVSKKIYYIFRSVAQVKIVTRC